MAEEELNFTAKQRRELRGKVSRARAGGVPLETGRMVPPDLVDQRRILHPPPYNTQYSYHFHHYPISPYDSSINQQWGYQANNLYGWPPVNINFNYGNQPQQPPPDQNRGYVQPFYNTASPGCGTTSQPQRPTPTTPNGSQQNFGRTPSSHNQNSSLSRSTERTFRTTEQWHWYPKINHMKKEEPIKEDRLRSVQESNQHILGRQMTPLPAKPQSYARSLRWTGNTSPRKSDTPLPATSGDKTATEKETDTATTHAQTHTSAPLDLCRNQPSLTHTPTASMGSTSDTDPRATISRTPLEVSVFGKSTADTSKVLDNNQLAIEAQTSSNDVEFLRRENARLHSMLQSLKYKKETSIKDFRKGYGVLHETLGRLSSLLPPESNLNAATLSDKQNSVQDTCITAMLPDDQVVACDTRKRGSVTAMLYLKRRRLSTTPKDDTTKTEVDETTFPASMEASVTPTPTQAEEHIEDLWSPSLPNSTARSTSNLNMSKPLVSAAAQLTKLPLHSTENAFDFMSPYDTKYSSQDVHELINKASSNLFGHLPPGKRVEINHIRVTPESLASFAEDYSGHTFQLLRASAICPASTKIVLDDERQFAISPTLRTISFVKFETTRFEQKGHWVHVLVDFARKELFVAEWLCRSDFKYIMATPLIDETDGTSCGPFAWTAVERILAPADIHFHDNSARMRQRHLTMLMSSSRLQTVSAGDKSEDEKSPTDVSVKPSTKASKKPRATRKKGVLVPAKAKASKSESTRTPVHEHINTDSRPVTRSMKRLTPRINVYEKAKADMGTSGLRSVPDSDDTESQFDTLSEYSESESEYSD